MTPERLVLASASPRRLALLREAGLDPEVLAPGVDETARAHETPEGLVRRLAETKGRVVAARLPRGAERTVVLAADTAVVAGGTILGKPTGDEEARRMLERLSGRRHEVLTGVFLMRLDDGRATSAVETTNVWFRELDARALDAYVARGEARDCAGAYAIQGAGAALVARIEGSWSNVVGLPVERLPDWARRIEVVW